MNFYKNVISWYQWYHAQQSEMSKYADSESNMSASKDNLTRELFQ